MTTVAVLYPTRGRAEQARKRVSDLLAQPEPKGVSLSVVAAIERDDAETYAAFRAVAADHPGRVHLLERQAGTTAVYGWNQAYAYARDWADWVVLGADDIKWRAGWLVTALETVRETGAQFVGLHDGHDPHRKYGPHYLVAVDFVEEHLGGVMAVPHYTAWGFDAEASERADWLGEYANAPGTPLDHLHPVWGLAPRDATYDAAWPQHEADRALRLQRRAQGYPTDYEPAKLEARVVDLWSEKKVVVDAIEPRPRSRDFSADPPPAVEVDATDAAVALAEEHGLDLTAVTGSGSGGRILKSDVQAAIGDQ